MATFLSPLGPLFGPNFTMITQNDETGREFQLQVYPDANNPELRANGRPTHYYFVPKRVFLAKKQTAPADFDFGMTVFKGLLTGETTIGITDDVTAGGAVETGGWLFSGRAGKPGWGQTRKLNLSGGQSLASISMCGGF